MRSRILATISLMCICISSLSGVTSSYVGAFGTLSSFETSPSIGAKGNFDFRSLVGNSGHVEASASAEIAFDFSDSSLSDWESLEATGYWYVGNEGELITSIGSQFTLAEDSTWIPDWSLGFRTTFPSWNLAPSVAYRGYVTDTYLSTAMELSTTYTPRVELAYDASITGALENYRDIVRTDRLIVGSVGIRGIVGYTTSWSTSLYGSYRESSDPDEDALSGQLESKVMYTPSRHFQCALTPSFQWEYHIGDHRWNTSLEVPMQADVVLGTRTYLYFSPSITFVDIHDPAASSYEYRFSMGVDVAL